MTVNVYFLSGIKINYFSLNFSIPNTKDKRCRKSKYEIDFEKFIFAFGVQRIHFV